MLVEGATYCMWAYKHRVVHAHGCFVEMQKIFCKLLVLTRLTPFYFQFGLWVRGNRLFLNLQLLGERVGTYRWNNTPAKFNRHFIFKQTSKTSGFGLLTCRRAISVTPKRKTIGCGAFVAWFSVSPIPAPLLRWKIAFAGWHVQHPEHQRDLLSLLFYLQLLLLLCL